MRPIVSGLAACVLALAAGATMAVIVLLAATAVVAAWQAVRARRQTAEAERQAARARAVQHFLEGMFEPLGLDHGDAAARQRLTAGDLLARAASQLSEGRVAADPTLAADLQGVVGKLLHDLALTEPAIELRRRRLLALQRAQATAEERAAALADLAESLHQRGDLAEAEQRMSAARDLVGGVGGRDAAIRHASLEARLATLRLAKGADDAELARLEAAIAELRRLAPGSAELADALVIFSTALSEHQQQVDRAYDVAREAVALLERRDDRRLRAARVRYLISLVLFAQRRYGEAEAETRRALDSYRRLAGEQHPTTAIVALALARQLTIHARLDESVPLIRQALPVLEAAGPAIDPTHLAEGRMALGEALLEEGRVAESLPELSAALAALRRLGAPIPVTVGAVLLARAQAESGLHDEALELLHETLDTRIGLWGLEHSSTALVMQRIGLVHMWAGRYDEAETWLRRVAGSQDVREHSFGSVKHRAAMTLVQLDVERDRNAEALGPATELREALLALPAEQRTRAWRINIELVWARALLGLGRADEAGPTLAALLALTGDLYPGAPPRLMVRAVRTRWLAMQQRTDEAAEALAEVEAEFALQPLSAHYRRLLSEARAGMPTGTARR
jgi:tetratricopeptide (TPR) repeat protein